MSYFPGFPSLWSKEKPKNKTLRCFILLTGKTLNVHIDMLDRLKREIPGLKVVQSEAECDIIMVFCPVIRGPALDIKAAVDLLNNYSGTRAAVLVLLHHTFDPECVVSDSRRAVNRDNTITVDCLFHEDQGLLRCQKNEESLTRIIRSIGHQSPVQQVTDSHQAVALSVSYSQNVHSPPVPSHHHQNTEEHSMSRPCSYSGDVYKPKKQESTNTERKKRKETPSLKYFTFLAGKTLNSHGTIIVHLKSKIPELQEVDIVDKCDYILAFCPIVSRAGTDIEAALKKLNQLSANKPAVLVVLHSTFNPECIVADSSRAVNRNHTITVDCLFHEDFGLLRCHKNNESLIRIINTIKPQNDPEDMETEQTPNLPTLKYFIKGNVHDEKYKPILDILTKASLLQEVNTSDECDYILTLCSGEPQDGAYITANKPVLQVSFPGSFEDHAASDPSKALNNVLTVHEDEDKMHSSENSQHDEEHRENMKEQEAGCSTQFSDKQENMLKVAEPSTSKEKTMEMKLQEKDEEIKKLKLELAEKNKQLEKQECLPDRSERQLEVKNQLLNTIQQLKGRKENLDTVSKLMNQDIEALEMSVIKLENEIPGKNRQIHESNIQDSNPPEHDKCLSNEVFEI